MADSITQGLDKLNVVIENDVERAFARFDMNNGLIMYEEDIAQIAKDLGFKIEIDLLKDIVEMIDFTNMQEIDQDEFTLWSLTGMKISSTLEGMRVFLDKFNLLILLMR